MARLEGPTVSPSSRLTRLAARGQFVWLCVVLSLWTVAVFSLPVDPDYTSGELLDHLLGWMEGGVLYPALGQGPTLRVLNYPPLVLLMARGLSEVGVPPLAAGRVTNTLGLLVLSAAVYGWARARGARGAAVLGTVGLLGASFGVVYGAAQMHIEFWAVGLTVAGAGLMAHGRDGDRLAALGTGVLLALACFAKQSQVVPAVVVLVWGWRFRPGFARAAAAAFAGVGVLGSAAITAAWGMEPWRHMLLYTVGTYSLRNLGLQFLVHVAPWSLLLAFAGWSVARERGRARQDLLVWYWVGSGLWALSSARLGSGYPYFLDLQVATVLLVGPALFSARVGRGWAWLLAVQVVGADVGAAVAASVPLGVKIAMARDLPLVCASFPPDGPVLAEEAGLARACGRVPVMHPFIMASLASRGLWDAAPFHASLRAGAYPAVVVPFDPRSPDEADRERWTGSALAAFREAPSVSPGPGGVWIIRW